MTPLVRRHAPPGAIGAALLAIGALGVGWLPPASDLVDTPVVAVFRDSLAGSLAARALVIIGLAFLLQAWLVLGYELASRARAGLAAPVRDIVTILAAWTVPLLLAPPMFSRDVYSYYVQGRVFEAGHDPTTQGVSVISGWFDDGADPMWVESPTPYGPVFLLLERGIASFTHPNAYFGALLFRLVAVAGLVMIVWFLPRLAAMHGIDGGRALWLGVLNPIVLMHFVSGAHNDALMVGLLVAGLTLAAQRSCVWGAVAVSLAATIKPIALLALPFTGLLWAGVGAPWSRRIRAWALSLVVMVCTLASALLLAGAGSGVFTAALSTPGGVLTWLSPTTMIGRPLDLLATWAGWTDDPGAILGVVRLVGAITALTVVAFLALRPEGRSPVRGAALALGVVVLLGPVIQPWYLLWFLPLFAATGLSGRALRVAILLTAVFTVHGMIESSTNADNLTDISDAITFAVAIGVVVAILIASRRERRLVLGADYPDLLPHSPHDVDRGAELSWPSGARMTP
jgi:hypothetical protein